MTELEQKERKRRLVRIRQVSTAMKWFITVVLVTIAVSGALVVAMILLPALLDVTTETLELTEVERALGDIPVAQRIGLSLVAVTAFALLLAICWNVRQLFDQFRKAAFFAPETLSRMIRIGIWLLTYGAFEVLSNPIVSVLLTIDFPEGQRQIDMELDGDEFFFIVFGALMLVFGWIMREAATIDEENRQFV